MPYNTEIPGQISAYQMRAIEIVARAVPKDGHVVEVGSLFGASSWVWAKSVDPSVTVHCVDPWEGNRGIAAMEARLGIRYGLEQFKIHTADCPNIVPHQGYSPRDFQDWDRSIDLYYEDAVHTDPILSQNLDFWGGHLRAQGIMCGDDYRGRFPDVRAGAARKARELGRDLIRVENFWCLFPEPAASEAMAAARTELEALSAEWRAEMEARGPHADWSPQKPAPGEDGRSVRLPLEITQRGLIAWPEAPAPGGLSVRLDVTDARDGGSLGTAVAPLGAGRLDPDIPHRPAPALACDGLDLAEARPVTLTLTIEGTNADLLRDAPRGGAGSVLGQWTRAMEGFHHLAEPHQGDLLDRSWDGRPIGILSVDLAQTPALHDHVVATMFPCLRPGSILVQHGYARPDRPWIHMEMARLRDHFAPCYTLRGATRFYRCVAPIPREACAAPASRLAYADQAALLDRERDAAEESVREVLKLAAARHALDHGDAARAARLLDGVRPGSLTDNEVQDFSPVETAGLGALQSVTATV